MHLLTTTFFLKEVRINPPISITKQKPYYIACDLDTITMVPTTLANK